jgi:hypothetical protein
VRVEQGLEKHTYLNYLLRQICGIIKKTKQEAYP